MIGPVDKETIQTQETSTLQSSSTVEGIPLDQWGSAQVKAYLEAQLNPNHEDIYSITEFVNTLINQGYNNGEALKALTRSDLDEMFPNRYLGYKKVLLNNMAKLKGETTTHTQSNIAVAEVPVQVHNANVSNNFSNDANHPQNKAQFDLPQNNPLSAAPLLSLAGFLAGLSSLKGESGTCTIGERSVRYEVSGRVHKFKWVYDGKVMDLTTQVQGRSRHYKSRNGALEHALKDLGNQLKARGVLTE